MFLSSWGHRFIFQLLWTRLKNIRYLILGTIVDINTWTCGAGLARMGNLSRTISSALNVNCPGDAEVPWTGKKKLMCLLCYSLEPNPFNHLQSITMFLHLLLHLTMSVIFPFWNFTHLQISEHRTRKVQCSRQPFPRGWRQHIGSVPVNEVSLTQRKEYVLKTHKSRNPFWRPGLQVASCVQWEYSRLFPPQFQFPQLWRSGPERQIED